MKKLLLILILLIPFSVFASNVTFNDVKNKSDNYIYSYNNNSKFIVLDNNLYGYKKNSGLYAEAGFNKSGLLNYDEYRVIGGKKSYLYDGLNYFTMTYNNNKTSVYEIYKNNDGYKYTELTNKSGARFTNYVKPMVKVSGEGTYVNPWKFILEGYTVSYNLNYGNNEVIETHSVNSSESYNLISAPSRSGFTFAGWSLQANGSGERYNANQSYTVQADTIFYAIWEQSYTITYDANGGSGGPLTDQSQATTAYVIKSEKPSHNDLTYGFKSWNTLANGTGTSYKAGDTMSVNENVTLYAQYAPYVARIDSKYYFTISDAVSAVNNNKVEETITMVRSTTENVTIPNTKKIKFNLNNLTVTGKMTNNGVLSVLNGTMANNSDNTFVNNNTLNVLSGNYSSTMDKISNISTFKNNGTMTVSGGTLGVNGYYDATTSTYYLIGVIENNSGAILNINGGVIGNNNMQTSAIHNIGTVNLTNGEISVGNPGNLYYYGISNGYMYQTTSYTNAVANITGGTLDNFNNYSQNTMNITGGNIICNECRADGTTTITKGTFTGATSSNMIYQYSGVLDISGDVTFTSTGYGIITSYGELKLSDAKFYITNSNSSSNIYAIQYYPSVNNSTISNILVDTIDSGISIGTTTHFWWGGDPDNKIVNINNVKINSMGLNLNIGQDITSKITNTTINSQYYYALNTYRDSNTTLDNTNISCNLMNNSAFNTDKRYNCANVIGSFTMNNSSTISGTTIGLLSNAFRENVTIYDDEGDEKTPPGITYLYLNSGTINGSIYGIAARASNMYFNGTNVTGGTYGVINHCDYLCYFHRYGERIVQVNAGNIYGGKYGLVNSLMSEFYISYNTLGSDSYSMNFACFDTVKIQGGSVRGGTKGVYNTSYNNLLKYYHTGGTVSP